MTREAISIRKRFEILTRDGYACQYCGAHAPHAKLVVDHCIPVAVGGTNDDFNLITACEPCNSGKSAMVTHRLECREAFHQYCLYSLQEYGKTDDAAKVADFASEYIHKSFYRVRDWCEPDMNTLASSIQGLLELAKGLRSDGSVRHSSARLMAALVLDVLGPAPVMIPAAIREIPIKDKEAIGNLIKDWSEELRPIFEWLGSQGEEPQT